jgi:hypothetical protein
LCCALVGVHDHTLPPALHRLRCGALHRRAPAPAASWRMWMLGSTSGWVHGCPPRPRPGPGRAKALQRNDMGWCGVCVWGIIIVLLLLLLCGGIIIHILFTNSHIHRHSHIHGGVLGTPPGHFLLSLGTPTRPRTHAATNGHGRPRSWHRSGKRMVHHAGGRPLVHNKHNKKNRFCFSHICHSHTDDTQHAHARVHTHARPCTPADCLVYAFCAKCALCQEAREVALRRQKD